MKTSRDQIEFEEIIKRLSSLRDNGKEEEFRTECLKVKDRCCRRIRGAYKQGYLAKRNELIIFVSTDLREFGFKFKETDGYINTVEWWYPCKHIPKY